jgi:hypothetical protein
MPLIGYLAGKKEKGIGRDYSGIIVEVGEQLKGKWEVAVDVFGLFSRPMDFFRNPLPFSYVLGRR